MGSPGNRTTKITHLAFADDFKLVSNKISNAKHQLDLVTQFSKDVGMKFGEDKCAYVYVEKGKKNL